MKPGLLSVKELALELGVSVQSVRRMYWTGLIAGYRCHKMLRFDPEQVRQALLARGLFTSKAQPAAPADGAAQPIAPER